MAVDPSKYQIYAEKDLNRAQIDWGTVGKTLSDGFPQGVLIFFHFVF